MISRTLVLYQKSLGRIFHHVLDLRRRRPFSSVGEILLPQEKLLKRTYAAIRGPSHE